MTDINLTCVTGLNNNGEVVGNIYYALTSGSFIYSQSTLKVLLPNTIVGNINDAGQIGLNSGSIRAPTLYNSHIGQYQIVGSPSSEGNASAVNQNGDAAGITTIQFDQLKPALFRNGQTLYLGSLIDNGRGYANALNNRDEVVGDAGSANGVHAFLYSGGSIHDLGALPGYSESHGLGINDSGQVIGSADDISASGEGLHRAFLYQNGAMKDLGTLGGINSVAYGINNAGVVVGWADNLTGAEPFVYSGGVMRDLFALVPDGGAWSTGMAETINDKGQIAGTAFHNGGLYIFLATPVAVPEPGAVACFGVGLVALGGLLRRRVRAALACPAAFESGGGATACEKFHTGY